MAVLKKMSEDEKKLFLIFKRAVHAERKAQEMYREAVGLCTDPMLKAVLTGFCEDEARHEKEVIARYHQFRKEYEADAVTLNGVGDTP